MRLVTLGFVALPLLLSAAACTAQGSSTTVQGPGSTSGSPVFPGGGDGTTDGGSAQDPAAVSDYAALFGPPAGADATPNSLNGLWAGTSGYTNVDTRVVFSGSSIVLALRCDAADPIGINVVARVTSSSIKTLESKTYVPPAGTSGGTTTVSSSCGGLGVVPFEIPRCTATVDADANYESNMLDKGCFFLSGTSLTFYDSSALVGRAKLTKLSD